VVAYYRVW